MRLACAQCEIQVKLVSADHRALSGSCGVQCYSDLIATNSWEFPNVNVRTEFIDDRISLFWLCIGVTFRTEFIHDRISLFWLCIGVDEV